MNVSGRKNDFTTETQRHGENETEWVWVPSPSAVNSTEALQDALLLCVPVSPWKDRSMLRLGQSHYDALRQHGEETYPHECCGVLLGRIDENDNRVVTSLARAGNTRTDSPQNRYNIDPKELVRIQREGRERGEDIIGFYHSHPDHPAQWSQTDLAEAHWFGCSYVITSVENGKAVLTNSWELMGTDEDDKKLEDERIEVV